jgi:hypothetical protein
MSPIDFYFECTSFIVLYEALAKASAHQSLA